MSALGQKRTLCGAAKFRLFDYLVGAAQQGEWDSQAKRLRGLQVYNELDFAGLLHRQICRLVTFKNTTDGNA